jgi:hypothetical protein
LPDSISSRLKRSLCFIFRCFSFGRFCFAKPPESLAPCWRTVATVYPLGNCDSFKLETGLNYLTRFETVSNRFWPLSSFFAFTDSARTLPEELVNPASGLCISRCKLRGVAPTSLTRPFPGRPGLSLRFPATFFRRLALSRSRIHGNRLGICQGKSGISLTTRDGLAPILHSLPPMLHMQCQIPIPG